MDNMTVEQLRKKAKSKGIKLSSKGKPKKKSALKSALKKAGGKKKKSAKKH
jgi:hypothetical protein